MKVVIVLVTCLVLARAVPVEKGNPSTAAEAVAIGIEPFIINGLKAEAGQFPWQVAIFRTRGDQTSFCGGSLISDQWVLTAGHCVNSLTTLETIQCLLSVLWRIDLWSRCWYKSFTIYLGSTSLTAVDENRQIVTTASAVLHPSYSNLYNDIALIKLEKPVIPNAYVKPIDLDSDDLGVNATIIVSGWGKTADADQSVSPSLNYVILTTISNEKCTSYYKGDVVRPGVVCATGPDAKSTCNGDSGGPVVIDKGGKPLQVASVSFVSSKGCESGYPSGYTRTAYYWSWIKKITGI